jgi:hypothetical protein
MAVALCSGERGIRGLGGGGGGCWDGQGMESRTSWCLLAGPPGNHQGKAAAAAAAAWLGLGGVCAVWSRRSAKLLVLVGHHLGILLNGAMLMG